MAPTFRIELLPPASSPPYRPPNDPIPFPLSIDVVASCLCIQCAIHSKKAIAGGPSLFIPSSVTRPRIHAAFDATSRQQHQQTSHLHQTELPRAKQTIISWRSLAA